MRTDLNIGSIEFSNYFIKSVEACSKIENKTSKKDKYQLDKEKSKENSFQKILDSEIAKIK